MHIRFSVPLVAASLFVRTEAQFSFSITNITLQLPTRVPAWREPLSPHLAGFSIEMDRWLEFAGHEVGKPNLYFNQLLQNLGERTGEMPILRVGANTQDRGFIDLSVPVLKSDFPPPTVNVPNPEATRVSIGRDFYALSGNLPAGTSFMWGLNLKSLNKSETVAQARLLADTFQGTRAHLTKNVKLVNVEIGNEPDFYGPTRFGVQGPYGSSWNVANYSATWVEFAEAVSREIKFGNSNSGYQCRGPTFSTGAFTGFMGPEWSPQGMLQAGILDKQAVQSMTSRYAGHAYSGGFDPRRVVNPGELMNKLSVRANMTIRTDGIVAVRSMGLNYILGETNSYANHGQPGLSNTVEAALWMTDWLLLAASLGIERVHFHHGLGFRYNTLQPTSESDDGLNITRPHILPSYHALLIVNEAIGKSGRAEIAEIATTNLTLTSYGIWEDGRLKRMVVMNTAVYLGVGMKSTMKVSLKGLEQGRLATIKLLESNMTTSVTGVKWAGQSFETISGRPVGDMVKEAVVGGVFDLPASAIALVTFDDSC
ncbi:glycoside hydrolase family 79 protein [Cadophora sp. DSE1049]|nr:glycoside hydrolase family 79 protein [Cadophora sp. DSE1049]